MFPLIPILALLFMSGGAGALYWYQTLEEDEKARANALATHYTWILFKKGVNELSAEEARIVHQRTKAHFN